MGDDLATITAMSDRHRGTTFRRRVIMGDDLATIEV